MFPAGVVGRGGEGGGGGEPPVKEKDKSCFVFYSHILFKYANAKNS